MSVGLGLLLGGLAWTVGLLVWGQQRWVRFWTRHDSGSRAFWSSPYPDGPDQVPRTYALLFKLFVGVGVLFVIISAVSLAQG